MADPMSDSTEDDLLEATANAPAAAPRKRYVDRHVAEDVIASLARCVESLDDLIRCCDDPGVEALGAVHEAHVLLRRVDSQRGQRAPDPPPTGTPIPDSRDRLVAALAAVYRPATNAADHRAVLEDLADAVTGISAADLVAHDPAAVIDALTDAGRLVHATDGLCGAPYWFADGESVMADEYSGGRPDGAVPLDRIVRGDGS